MQSDMKNIIVRLSTLTDEVLLNEYLDNLNTKVEDTWSDVSVDYASIDEYIAELLDNDYLIESGIVKIVSDVEYVDVAKK